MAKPEKIYRVLAVEGLLCQHPGSIGTGQVHHVSHMKTISDDLADVRYPFGLPVPGLKFTFNGTPECIRETGDGYLLAKIRSGELDYVETVEAFDAPEGSGVKERTLVEMTAANRARRGETVTPAPAPVVDTPADPPAAPKKK